jgi:hypothetical protein
MEPVPINRFNKKTVLEPVYETGLPALFFVLNYEKVKKYDS